MTNSSSISAAAAAAEISDQGGGTPITAIHPDIIQSHILKRLDGPTLASTSCASAQFLSLCSDDQLWKDICNSTWPSTTDPCVCDAISSFPSGHRSFYSDSFPALRHHSRRRLSKRTSPPRVSGTPEFISAVDIFYDDQLIYSKVLVTETNSAWFLNSPFKVELLGAKEMVATPLKFDGEEGACMGRAEERLRVSWVLIDPVKKRSVNLASAKAVEARRHWLTEDIQLRYATVVAGSDGELVQYAVVVTCAGKEGGDLHVREVCMHVEDIEGKILTGMDSLVILDEAMEGPRRKSEGKIEKDIYEMFVRMKVQYRERKQQKETNMDIICMATGISIFFAFWMLFFLSKK